MTDIAVAGTIKNFRRTILWALLQTVFRAGQ